MSLFDWLASPDNARGRAYARLPRPMWRSGTRVRSQVATRPSTLSIGAAIRRFERGTVTEDHDGRLIAENLGTAAGFGGSAASHRQQVQQYFSQFPELRRRWRIVVGEAASRADRPARDLQAELNAARAEAARLRRQLAAMDRVADRWRCQAQRFERQLAQRQRADALTTNVVQLRWVPESPTD